MNGAMWQPVAAAYPESPGFRRGLGVKRHATRDKKPRAEARGHREHAASPATITPNPNTTNYQRLTLRRDTRRGRGDRGPAPCRCR